ncbi:hypothetical protein BDZ89DRAFT_1059697 [Hymenopellis radicata]|nr:hypothetical protein BDZ89DRAFT_1059697 [Hymenopellis radicata]
MALSSPLSASSLPKVNSTHKRRKENGSKVPSPKRAKTGGSAGKSAEFVRDNSDARRASLPSDTKG